MDCSTKVSFLKDTLKNTYLRALEDGLKAFETTVESQLGPVNALEVELEIAFRTLLDEISQDQVDKLLETKSPVRQLLNFSFALIHRYRGASSAKGILRVPYLLFADLLDGQTIEGAEKIWDLVESSIEQLTDSESFNSGRFIILKACKTLLRRLSKSCNPELCGRVLQFLSAAYDINERSAVNHLGKINTGNVTIYEDEVTFRETERIAASMSAAAALAASTSTLESSASSSSSSTSKVVASTTTKDSDGEEGRSLVEVSSSIPIPLH